MKQKSKRLNARLGEAEDHLASARAAEQETASQLLDTGSRLHETATQLLDAESRLHETELRLDQTSERLETIQARLQRASAERTELRRRADLLRVWRLRNWPEYVAIAWTRFRTSLRRRDTAGT